MKIAIDYDNTYTADPVLWDAFMKIASSRGHQLKIVTLRNPLTEAISEPLDVIYTNRFAKYKHYNADVWIDDSPRGIYEDSL